MHEEYRSWLVAQGVGLPPFRTLDPRGATSIYASGAPPSRSYPDPASLAWARVVDDKGHAAQPWYKGATSTDPKQGQLGNCWLISAMSLIATRDGEVDGAGGRGAPVLCV
jgi:hypothetical protein